MKKFIVFLLLFSLSAPAYCYTNYNSTYVHGYTNSNGTYVQGHYRSTPNNTQYDNWSTKGNYNPRTMQSGTRNIQPNYGFNTPRTKKYNSFGY